MTGAKPLGASQVIGAPITSPIEDRLGFIPAANQFAASVMSAATAGGVIVGIQGTWGSGKSSFSNLVKLALSKGPIVRTKEGYGHSELPWLKPVVVEFRPWLISNRTAMIANLFEHLVEAVSKQLVLANYEKSIVRSFRKPLIESLRKLSGLVTATSAAAQWITPAGAWAVGMAGVAAAGELLREKLGRDTVELEAAYNEVKRLLRDLATHRKDLRYVVVVDDLDRLDPPECVEILRVLKSVADFPLVTYVLLHDEKQTAEMIEKVIGVSDGREYLEKIILYSYRLPPPEAFQLRRWLRETVQTLEPELTLDTRRASAILDVWAGRLIKTPRDVIRISTAIATRWPSLRGTVDLLDLTWFELIKEQAAEEDADLCTWIMEYLVCLDAIAIGGQVTGEEELAKRLRTILVALGWQVLKRGKDGSLVDYDPHYLDEILYGVRGSILDDQEELKILQSSSEALAQFSAGKRLTSPWHWRLYVAGSAPTHALTDVVWESLIHAGETSRDLLETQLGKALDQASEFQTSLTDQILQRAQFAFGSGRIRGQATWAHAVMNLAERLVQQSRPTGWFDHRYLEDELTTFVRAAFRHLQVTEKLNLALPIFQTCSSYWAISVVFRSECYRIRENVDPSDRDAVFPSTALEPVSRLVTNRFLGMSINDFVGAYDPVSILYAWKEAASAEMPSSFLRINMEDNAALLTVLDALLTNSSTAQNGVAHLNVATLSPFVDIDDCKRRLSRIAVTSGEPAIRAQKLNQLWWDDPDERRSKRAGKS